MAPFCVRSLDAAPRRGGKCYCRFLERYTYALHTGITRVAFFLFSITNTTLPTFGAPASMTRPNMFASRPPPYLSVPTLKKGTAHLMGEGASGSTGRLLSYPTPLSENQRALTFGTLSTSLSIRRSNDRMGDGVVVEYVQGSWGTIHIPLTRGHSTHGQARDFVVQLTKACTRREK